MRIANKISLYFLVTTTILSVIAVSIFYTVTKRNTEKMILEHLNTAVHSRAYHIETFLEDHKHTMELISSDNLFKELLMTNENNPKYDEILQNVNAKLNTIAEHQKGTLMIGILDINGIVIASTNKTSIGSDKSEEKSYLKAQEATYIGDVHISKIFKTYAIPITAPVFLNDELIGIISADHKAEELFKITSDRTGLGETGEIYLVNRDLYMISPSRFKEDVILKQKVDTINAKKSLIHKNEKYVYSLEEMNIFPDYRGVSVLGTFHNLPEMQWGILAKIDEKEAFAPLYKLRFLFFSLLIFIPIMAWVIGVFASRSISRPIYKLHKGAEIIGKGNLDFKVGTDSKDEIGRLSRAFDKMTEDLKKTTTSIDELNKEIAERQLTEEALRSSEKRYRTLFEAASKTGQAIIIQQDRDGIESACVFVNDAAEQITGYSKEELARLSWLDIVHPNDRNAATERYKRRMRGEIISDNFEITILRKDGTVLPVELASVKTEFEGKGALVSLYRDIGERKEAEKALHEYTEALEISNKELEQFAYVASHDLQEPLRMVASYTQLLAKRYKGKLDSDADEFIAFAVDGATRMQVLINDILAYSRVGTRGKEFQPTDCKIVLDNILSNLQKTIEESDAEITCDPLPIVSADDVQLGQLFQNLIMNAIKFKSDNSPRIHISAEKNEKEWIFSVKDNGIGIDPQFAERIFEIFKRLHGRAEYPGTGIGLAITKKIVERHGGRIWMESEPGNGSTFRFTIPNKRRD